MNEIPLYEKIYNYVYEGIKNSTYSVGEKIPSEKELSQQFSVSRITSKKALNKLAENKLIRRIPGKGSFVLNREEETTVENSVVNNSNYSKTMLIGLIVPSYGTSFGLKLVMTIEEETAKKGYVVIQRLTFDNQEIEDKSIDLLIDLGVKGLVIMPVSGEHYNPKILKLILDGFPVVFIDRNLKGIQTSFVGTDNIAAAKKATDYLLNSGHRHIGYISKPINEVTSFEDRLDGFIKSHAENGVMADESIWYTDFSGKYSNEDKNVMQKDINNIKALLVKNPQITCIFAAEYEAALFTMEVAKQIGLRVPEDLSILCFDSPYNGIGDVFFTNLKQREREMGITAVRLLSELTAGNKEYKKVFLDADLIIGKSTSYLKKD